MLTSLLCQTPGLALAGAVGRARHQGGLRDSLGSPGMHQLGTKQPRILNWGTTTAQQPAGMAAHRLILAWSCLWPPASGLDGHQCSGPGGSGSLWGAAKPQPPQQQLQDSAKPSSAL